ncbi:histidine kinase dimerization/phospho-acceptor domain-containing protein [Rubrivirga sp. S365]|uniref:histidine kinase n=1 Tax=Rubrivirga litoralis TaxID=3075598 RepID=A0ABU3BMM7_9BACT|nr:MULTISPECIES: histidine kinase dimerization/phospho-acceptor domain-containing protein [unclassified Rubrivirga]MDT0630486.1 histidine kinase dimerization/phospho-acceptor domain-containing protein [Rubrivirga sp. F394]MDT7857536.1 histidine kinase dimerization/phospho-acceptor domain-containing protein [Rubrivirga sp. S365]
MPPPTVLLVGPDAEQWAARADADVTAAPDLDAARAYLAGTVFDAVWVQDGLPVAGLRALRDALGLATTVGAVASYDDVVGHLARAGEPAAGGRAGRSTSDERQALVELRDEMSRVAHALNNPLSVIAGNAQLGLELGNALGLDPDVQATFEEIQQAATDLGDLFSEVAALRARIDRLLS